MRTVRLGTPRYMYGRQRSKSLKAHTAGHYLWRIHQLEILKRVSFHIRTHVVQIQRHMLTFERCRFPCWHYDSFSPTKKKLQKCNKTYQIHSVLITHPKRKKKVSPKTKHLEKPHFLPRKQTKKKTIYTKKPTRPLPLPLPV